MRISSKKVLAIVLSVAMLVSCMVFSFSASANQTTFDWTIDLEGSAQQSPYTGTAVTGNAMCGTSGIGSVAVVDGGYNSAKALQLTANTAKAGFVAGFRVSGADGTYTDSNSKVAANVKTLVSFRYKPVTVTGATDIYVALGGAYWLRNGGNSLDGSGESWGYFYSSSWGTAAKAKAVTVETASTEWAYASVLLSCTSTNGIHFGFTTDAVGTVILVDDIRVRNFTGTTTTVSYVYNDMLVGQADAGIPGDPLTTPALDIPMILPQGYGFVAYTDATYTTKADVSVYPNENTTVYLKAEKTSTAAVDVEDYDRVPFLNEDGTPGTSSAQMAIVTNAQAEAGTYKTYKGGVLTPLAAGEKIAITTKDGATYWQYANTFLVGNGSGRWATNAYNHTDDSGASVAFNPQPYSQNYPAATQLKHPTTGSNFTATANNTGYVVKFWVRAGAGMTGTAKFSLKNTTANGHNAATAKTVELTEQWQQVELTIDAMTSGDALYLMGCYTQFPAGLDTGKTEFENLDAGVDCFIYVDDISIEDKVVFTYTADYTYTNTFENATVDGKNIELYKSSGSNVQYSNDKNHTWADGADTSVKVYGTNRGGAYRPQFNLTADNGETLCLQDDTAYEVSMWVYSDTTNTKDGIGLWLIAADDDDAATWDGGDDRAKYDVTVEKETSVADTTLLTRGEWKQFTFTITPESVAAAEANGVEVVGKPLRLGVCNDTNKFTIYIDDVKVKVIEESNAWSFETEKANTSVALTNYTGESRTVSNLYAHTGTQSLELKTATNAGGGRGKFMVKDADGNTVQLTAGESYIINAWVYLPEGDNVLSVSTYLGVANSETPTNLSSSKGTTIYDDWDGSANGSKVIQPGSGWQQVTYYVSNITSGGYLYWGLTHAYGIGDVPMTPTKMTFYVDDITVTNAADMVTVGDANHSDRTAYLYNGTSKKGATNLHKHTTNNEDDDIYTSIRLAAKYTAGNSDGSTIILDGVEYEIVERGIVAGKAGMSLDATGEKGTDYLWKSSKTAEEGLDTYFKRGATVTAGANDPTEITFTLRLANMNADWFAENYTQKFQYRSYYKVKVAARTSGKFNDTDTVLTVYGNPSEAKTFLEMADTFTKSFWFTDLP